MKATNAFRWALKVLLCTQSMPLKSRYLCYRLIRLQDFGEPRALEISNVARLAEQVGCSKSAISTCLKGLVGAEVLVCEKRRTLGRPLDVYSFAKSFLDRRVKVSVGATAEVIDRVLNRGLCEGLGRDSSGKDPFFNLTDPERCLLALAWFEVSTGATLYFSGQSLASRSCLDRSRIQSVIRSLVRKGFIEEHAEAVLMRRGPRCEKRYSLLGEAVVGEFEHCYKSDIAWSDSSVQDVGGAIDGRLKSALSNPSKTSRLLYQGCMHASRYYPHDRFALERRLHVIMQRSLLEVCEIPFQTAGFDGYENMNLKAMTHSDQLVAECIEGLAYSLVSKLLHIFSGVMASAPVSRSSWVLVSYRPVEIGGVLHIRASLISSGKVLDGKFGVVKA